MKKITLDKPVQLVAQQVKTFPLGIGETFDNLSDTLPDGANRPFYGISWMEGESVIYYAAAEQKAASETKTFGLEPWTVEAGEYLAVQLKQWREKTASMKDIFHELMQDPRTDKTKPCVEWYQSDEEMLCMMKLISN